MDVKHTCSIAIATGEQKCAIGDHCECGAYCVQYKQLYNEIISGGKYCYLTISPKMIQYEEDEEKLDFWLSEFLNLRKCSDKYIIVVEYTKKMILHFHMMVKVKDRIKWNRGLIQRWYHLANIEPIYSQPKHGIHYLFKEIDSTKELLGKRVIYTNEDLDKVKTQRVEMRKQFSKVAKCDNLDEQEEDYD